MVEAAFRHYFRTPAYKRSQEHETVTGIPGQKHGFRYGLMDAGVVFTAVVIDAFGGDGAAGADRYAGGIHGYPVAGRFFIGKAHPVLIPQRPTVTETVRAFQG